MVILAIIIIVNMCLQGLLFGSQENPAGVYKAAAMLRDFLLCPKPDNFSRLDPDNVSQMPYFYPFDCCQT